MELVYIRDPEQIDKCSEFVWDMCQKSYKPIGGFLSIQDKKDFTRRVDLLKLVLVDSNNNTSNVGACGLYRERNGGFKGIGFASNKEVPNYRECVKLILRDDIVRYSDWYWTEASHGISKMLIELGGYAIPNVYVPEILNGLVSDNDLCDDGFTYRRTVGSGKDKRIVEKEMFGFANQETYDTIISDYGTFENFVNYLEQCKPNWNIDNADDFGQILSEAADLPSYKLPKLVRACIGYIYNLDDVHTENDIYEVPQKWLDNLEYSLKVLRLYSTKYPVRPVVKAVADGEALQKQLTPLVLHHFGKIMPPPHTEI